MDLGRIARGLTGLQMLILAVLLFFIGNAAANPLVPGPTFHTAQEGILEIAWLNFFVDLFMLSALVLLICCLYGKDVGRITKRTWVFVMEIVVCALIVALIGGVIDFYFLYSHGPDGYYENGHHVVLSAEGFLAAVEIFASVYLASLLVMRIEWRRNLIPASGMALVSPISWVFATMVGKMGVLLLVSVFLLISIATMYGLAIWHYKQFHVQSPG